MMKRAIGATLVELMETTGWPAHTVRGFVSILSRKRGVKLNRSRNGDGERTYRIVK